MAPAALISVMSDDTPAIACTKGVKTKRRAYFPRKRTGCLTCKTRHVRCDEQRPTCTNCMVGRRGCQYPSTQLPLREARAQARQGTLPGEQEPWVITSSTAPSTQENQQLCRVRQHVPNTLSVVDPFGSLPIKMEFRSNEVFYHYANFENKFSTVKREGGNDCLGAVIHEPTAFRSACLLAVIHHSWKAGAPVAYDPTFLSHKIASIREVNEWLADPSIAGGDRYTRLITTLSFVECCSGNIVAAEAHLSGLITLLDATDAKSARTGGGGFGCDELTIRYIMIVYTFVAAIKSRIDMTLYPRWKNKPRAPSTMGLEAAMQNWMEHDPEALDLKLMTLRTMPSFLTAPTTDLDASYVDATQVVDALRRIIRDHEIYLDDMDDLPGDWLWSRGEAGRILISMVNTHNTSTYTKGPGDGDGDGHGDGDGDEPAPIMSDWKALSAVVHLFNLVMLQLLDPSTDPYARFLPRVIRLVEQDLRRYCYGDRQIDRDMRMWKAFIGLVSVYVIKNPQCYDMKLPFLSHIRAWSDQSGVVKWVEARAVLQSLAWPETFGFNGLTETLWYEALAL